MTTKRRKPKRRAVSADQTWRVTTADMARIEAVREAEAIVRDAVALIRRELAR